MKASEFRKSKREFSKKRKAGYWIIYDKPQNGRKIQAVISKVLFDD